MTLQEPEIELFFLEQQKDAVMEYFTSHIDKLKRRKEKLTNQLKSMPAGEKLSDAVNVRLQTKDDKTFTSAIQDAINKIDTKLEGLSLRLRDLNPRPYEDVVMTADIFDRRDFQILENMEDYRQGKLILGRAVTLPADRSPEYAGHMWVQVKPTEPHFLYGLELSPIPRNYVRAKRGTTRDQRMGIRRIEYNETFLDAFEQFHKYCAAFSKLAGLETRSPTPLVFLIYLEKGVKQKLEMFNPRRSEPTYIH